MWGYTAALSMMSDHHDSIAQELDTEIHSRRSEEHARQEQVYVAMVDSDSQINAPGIGTNTRKTCESGVSQVFRSAFGSRLSNNAFQMEAWAYTQELQAQAEEHQEMFNKYNMDVQ